MMVTTCGAAGNLSAAVRSALTGGGAGFFGEAAQESELLATEQSSSHGIADSHLRSYSHLSNTSC